MGRASRWLTRVGYRWVVRPVLFRLRPDWVHARHVALGAWLHRRHWGWLLRGWRYHDRRLHQQVAGLDCVNPVGLAAGFDKNARLVGILPEMGFGFATIGSVTAQPGPGNARPWFYRLVRSRSLVVNAGLPSDGVQAVAGRLAGWRRRRPAAAGMPLVVSVALTNLPAPLSVTAAIEDYCASLHMLEHRAVADLYEINISCPNTHCDAPFATPDRLERLLAALDGLGLRRPISVKLPVDLTAGQLDDLMAVVVRHRVAAVTIGNLRRDRSSLGGDLSDPLPDSVPGSLSGLPTRDHSTELIRRAYAGYGDRVAIIGVGGVMSAADAYAKIRAGASLVGLVSGLIFGGPQLVGDINAGLVRLLERDGFQTIDQAVGADHRAPAGWADRLSTSAPAGVYPPHDI